MRLVPLLILIVFSACDPKIPAPPLVLDVGFDTETDGGSTDTGFGADAGETLNPDSGVGRHDGGIHHGDTGREEPTDSGPLPGDSGVVVIRPDTGTPVEDGGGILEDAGQPEPPDDHGDRFEDATELGDRRQISGQVDERDDLDFFTFVTDEAGRYQVFTTGPTDTECALLSDDGQVLAENDDGGDGFNCRIRRSLEANQRYGVRVSLWGGGNRWPRPYELHIVGPPAPPSVCGDGEVEGVEECDDGNENTQDACLNCRRARCGDGVTRLDLLPGQLGHEFCDDGNDDSGDTCTTDCAIPRCGDGFVWRGVEECDDGNAIDEDGCRLTCRVARCGDGVIFVGVEACDDGNQIGGDGCGVRCNSEVVPADCEAVPDRNRATIYCGTPRRTWEGAEAFCVEWGGHLVSVDNDADQRRLTNYTWRGSDIWIGLNDLEEEGSFQWAGRASDFRNWSDGEPNNSGGSEDCAHLWRRAWGAWNDGSCEQDLAFFCEQ